MRDESGAEITGGGRGAPVATALLNSLAAFIAARNASDCSFHLAALLAADSAASEEAATGLLGRICAACC